MSTSSRAVTGTPPALGRAREIVEPALRAAVDRLEDERMRRVAGYQLGWWDTAGEPTPAGGGKAVRPALAVLAAEAACGSAEAGIAAAVAVELVHNFSLLHDDIMDGDLERRHRPTGWVAFGEGQAILAGNAMLTAALEVLIAGPHPDHTVPAMLATVQRLIGGQSADLALEQRRDAQLADVLDMEAGKTGALIAGSLTIGALCAGVPDAAAQQLGAAGDLVGLAFQLVDDVLGVVGDPTVTGKSASSDVRAGKCSAPIVAALRSGTAEAGELAALLDAGPPQTDDEVARAVSLVEAAGGITWATAEAERLLQLALTQFAESGMPHPRAVGELCEVAAYLVRRDR
jgi:geranylgeranyl diphosphate synthase type I